jgi:hydroxypyruvate reductase
MTTATGAIIDGLTVQQGAQQNLNAVAYLKKADSNSFFKVTNNLITTGATGTNVMDLVIGIYHQK